MTVRSLVASRRNFLAGAGALGISTKARAALPFQRSFLWGQRASYLGFVATRGSVPTSFSGSLHAWMNRSLHIAVDNITSLQAIWGNWWADNAGEHATGAASTITASIEYPAGVFTQIKFNGATQGSIASGANIVCDACAVNIPKGAQFWVRAYLTNASVIVFSALTPGVNLPATRPSLMNYTTPTDQTMGGTVVVQATGSAFYNPLAIIGMTRRPSIFLAGDSRVCGYQDIPDVVTGDVGNLARALLTTFGYVNAGVPSEQAAQAVSNYTKRATLLPYCTHVIDEYGINDTLSFTAAQIAANRTTLATSIFKGKTVFGTTIEPDTTSIDSWATTGNQTKYAQESVRTAFNALALAGIPGEQRCFDINNAVNSSANSGLWAVNGTANWATPDGVHETAIGNGLIVSSGVIPISAFRR